MESCRLIAEWSGGGNAQTAAAAHSLTVSPPVDSGAVVADQYITADQVVTLETICADNGIELARLKVKAKVGALAMILAKDYQRAVDYLDAVIAKKHDAA